MQRQGVGRNVVALGFTSLLTDISSEMLATALPLYLVWYLRLTPLEFGVVDGLYQGVAALVRVAGGAWSDRASQHKTVAAIGYGLSAVCKLALLAAGGVWTAIGAVVLLDRLGKGLRTAPRDALIALSAPPERLATAFGVHRTLDTTGAFLGPFVTFAVLALAPNAFDAVFVVSFLFAVLGLGVLALFVAAPRAAPPNPDQARVPGVGDLLRAVWRTPRFPVLLGTATLLALVVVSDAFVYLVLQRRTGLPAGWLPLLFAGTALASLLLAAPVGRLADRVGRAPVFLAGQAHLVAVYVLLLVPALGLGAVPLCLLLLGAWYAATDGVLAALASGLLPAAARASGLAVLAASVSLARLAASVGFGALWTHWSLEGALTLYLAGLLAAIVLAAILLPRQFGSFRRGPASSV